MNRQRALFSIHDVMPQTLATVSELRERLLQQGRQPPALLVVPGREWQPAQLDLLRGWARDGSELIAHGWRHHCIPRSLRHRLHALLISRDVAEHLAETADGVCRLMQRSADWFADRGLPVPDSYTPPAWALGMAPRHLRRTPFQRVETLGGIHFVGPDAVVFRRLPLLGFEADTALRAGFLRQWNALQRRSATRRDRPLRIGLHPGDLQLRLAADLEAIIAEDWECLRYDALQSE
jgi:predicted deacetylase